MKKIFDWTVGSFFRTIGRAIAFFVMAMLVYYLLSYNDIDFGIKNLFFDKVNASSLDAFWVGDYSDGATGTWSYDSNLGYIYSFRNMNTQYNYNNEITLTNTIPNKNNYIYINGYLKGILASPTINLKCNGWDSSTNTCEEWYDDNNSLISFQLWAGSYTNQCKIKWNTSPYNNSYNDYLFYEAECPSTGTVSKLYYRLAISETGNYHQFQFGLNRSINFIKDGSQSIIDNQNQNTQDIINSQNQNTQAITNQTQQAQQQHQETMNSSTTDAENDASSFFGNFTVEDQGGLSAIVTAPLNTIRSLLSSTCADLVLPLPFVEEDLTLPCMYSIYSQHFGAFFSLYQTIILGIIAYRCIMSIFFDIKGFTNPNDDRIEVMDL